MSRSKFYDTIKDVIDERGVETPYKNGLTLYFPNTDYTYPFKCDGYMEPVVNGSKFRLIIEYKLDELLNDKSGKAKQLTFDEIRAFFFDLLSGKIEAQEMTGTFNISDFTR